MRVRMLLVGVLLAGAALVAAAEPVAGRPRETEAERIARETIAAVRASERAGLTTSLAPVPRRLAVAGPLAGRWTTCQLPEGFNPVGTVASAAIASWQRDCWYENPPPSPCRYAVRLCRLPLPT